MKHVVALLLALGISASAAPSDESLMYSMPGPNGKQLGFYVTAEMWERTPEWIFDGKNPPLSLSDAYPKAYDSMRKRFPKFDGFRLYRYNVQRFNDSRTPNRWYYTFDFVPLRTGSELWFEGRGLTAMVLMDGTVVEPREKELKR